jgi:energy-coupling factor transporter ATP-binding protein EcfA2
MQDENSGDVSVTVSALTFSDGTEIKLNPDDIVVFVGPNNAGKSACLKEIEAHLGRTKEPKNVIKYIDINKIGESKDAYNYIKNCSHESYNNGDLHFSGAGYQINSSIIDHSWSNDFKHLRAFFCRRLKTESRITDSDPAPSYSVLDQPATRPIQIIFSDSDVEKRLSGYFKEAFGCDLIVFKGGGTKIPLFVGERVIPEHGEDSTSKTFLQRLTRAASPLHEQGDGMRSFASVVLEMLASEAPSILLLDEPEAFLHPPQARLIGEFLAKERRSDAQMFIATHSPEVLLGLLNVAPQQLRIIRIQRSGSINSVKELEK